MKTAAADGRRVLVTGASGFAGSHLLDLLTRDGATAIGWCRPGNGLPDASGRVEWARVDILDADAVRRAIAAAPPSVVYHCAGAAHTGQSWQQASATLKLNVLGTHHLLEALRVHAPDSRVLIPGSALVYGPSDAPLAEDSPLGPKSPYATSKLAQEHLGFRVARDEGRRVFLTRSFNHIGPGQDPSFATSSFARQIARIEAGIGEPVIHVGNLDARRDLTDVRDIVRAYSMIVSLGRPGRIYNACSGQGYRMADILDRLLAQARTPVTIQTDADRLRPLDVPVVVGDGRRLRDELGWTPEIPIERTLGDLLDYWRNRVSAP